MIKSKSPCNWLTNITHQSLSRSSKQWPTFCAAGWELSHQDEHFKAGLASLSVPRPHLPRPTLPPQLLLPVLSVSLPFLQDLPPPESGQALLSFVGVFTGHERNQTSSSPPESTFWLLPPAQRGLTFHFCLVLLFFLAFLHSDLSNPSCYSWQNWWFWP